MLRKYVKCSVIFVTLFSCLINKVCAYEYEKPENEQAVNKLITEIYDSKEMYEYLAGDYQEYTPSIYNVLNSSYWLPIGSEETVEIDGKIYAKGDPHPSRVTSNYGYRQDPITGEMAKHTGIDIAGGVGNGIVNIIAAKAGIVVYPTAGANLSCPSNDYNCNNGTGNYVVIQHSDGNFTLYAHLHENSILVKAGDSVEQGQVIGKMGSSGYSTGTHLHFEVREGQNNLSATVDPLEYISFEAPRIVSSGGDFLKWLNSWEGHSPIEGEHYIVENIGDGVRTVGGGVTLENNPDKFLSYGIDIADYPVGSKIPINIVDQIQLELISGKRSYVENILSNNSIELEEIQIEALVSQVYNIGNINGFADNYIKYGNTQEFYDNWFFRALMKGTKFEKGLTRRRNAEWSLFHLGTYVYN